MGDCSSQQSVSYKLISNNNIRHTHEHMICVKCARCVGACVCVCACDLRSMCVSKTAICVMFLDAKYPN